MITRISIFLTVASVVGFGIACGNERLPDTSVASEGVVAEGADERSQRGVGTESQPATDAPAEATENALQLCCEDVLGVCIPWDVRECPSGTTEVDCPCISSDISDADETR